MLRHQGPARPFVRRHPQLLSIPPLTAQSSERHLYVMHQVSRVVDLSIIIPAYNEGPEFGPRMKKRWLVGWPSTTTAGVEVIIMMQSDDHSPAT